MLRRSKLTWLIGLTAALAVAWTLTAQQPAQVDDNALKAAAKNGENWIEYNGSWMEQRYSALNQINDSNVARLGLAWYTDIPSAPAGTSGNRQEATPLVYDGKLFSITPWSIVYSVDLHTGKEIWRSDPEVNQQVNAGRICCGVVNRGIAMYEGKIIAPVVDGRIRALDMSTGKILWETRVTPANQPYSITMAPRVIKGGKVIVGASGGEFGVRGFFDAYDVNTGKQAWRFYTVPGDPSKPFEQPWLADWAKTWDPQLNGGRSAAADRSGAASPMIPKPTISSTLAPASPALGRSNGAARATISAPIASSLFAAQPANSFGITRPLPETIGISIPSPTSCWPTSPSMASCATC